MVEILRKGAWKEKIKGGEKEKEAYVYDIKSHEYGGCAK